MCRRFRTVGLLHSRAHCLQTRDAARCLQQGRRWRVGGWVGEGGGWWASQVVGKVQPNPAPEVCFATPPTAPYFFLSPGCAPLFCHLKVAQNQLEHFIWQQAKAAPLVPPHPAAASRVWGCPERKQYESLNAATRQAGHATSAVPLTPCNLLAAGGLCAAMAAAWLAVCGTAPNSQPQARTHLSDSGALGCALRLPWLRLEELRLSEALTHC